MKKYSHAALVAAIPTLPAMQPRLYPIGTALRDGKPIPHVPHDELASINAKIERNKVFGEQERIAKGRARKARREARRAS